MGNKFAHNAENHKKDTHTHISESSKLNDRIVHV